ncbi:kinesin heavy-chain domain-containing protein [Chloropicon primus]|uniref:Kinesin-like protein n=2 Tax=Chloropicon primus TaxID=1764295 RepID=A0A5B8MBW5_9CHLO|nr:kinesin heavy-chain domain-containing protein [Chloropicon primus]UPQ96837.1 kinesin heavy-chain domain-containing protein [Chloropicon primus]|eukprot:QDZ17621.1 kinesin heavy-chain domain-containing protein [Chloropicon primus]
MTRKSRNSILKPRKLEEMFDSLSEDEAETEVDVEVDVGGKRKRESTVPGKMEVLLRIRPTPQESYPECIHATGPNSIAISAPENHMGTKNAEKSRIFAFSKVLQAETTNRQLFTKQFSQRVNNTLLPTSESLVVFAYGITATGKTHSMEGTRDDPGIIPQTIQLLFHNKTNEEEVSISMYEIYNENLYDMLNYTAAGSAKPRSLKLKEDGSGQIWIPGLSQNLVETAEEARQTLINGLGYRKHAATGMNKKSSRSHAVVMINIRNSVTKEWQSSISFIDLAGSERQTRTGNDGIRLKESVAINSSLMTLGRCLKALRWNHDNKQRRKKHVPFRQAKITHAFKNAFLGSGSTVLMVNVSASARDYDETVHVLKYASLATALPCSSQPKNALMNIEPAAKRQKETATAKTESDSRAEPAYVSPQQDESELFEENEELNDEIDRLKSELFESERRAAEMEARIREEVAEEMSELLREMEKSYHTRLEAEVTAARNAASAVGNTSKGAMAEMKELKEELKQAELELSSAKGEIETIQRANEENEHALVDSFKSLLEEETTQLKANAAMEKETLELQLDRQRQENEELRLRLKRMKEATRAALRRYNANMSPTPLLGSPLALSNLLVESEKEHPSSVGEKEASQQQDGEYDVDMSDFVIKNPSASLSENENNPAQKENLPAAAQDAKKGKKKKKKRPATSQLAHGTPVARRTRAGRRACAAIENVRV